MTRLLQALIAFRTAGYHRDGPQMISRSALIWLSRQEGLKDFATSFRLFKKLTTRFVAGETIDDAVSHIRAINAENCTASFDHLNESVATEAEAEAEVVEYLN